MACRCSWWCIWKKQSGWRKESIRVKKIVPAGIFYYRMKDPIVGKELDEEKLEEAILKELRLDGIIRQEDAVIQRLDADFSGNSLVIPAGKTKSGYSKASKMLLPEEFDAVLTYAQKDGLIFREQCTAERRRHCRMRWVHKMAVRIAHTGISADLMSRSKDMNTGSLRSFRRKL